MATVIVTQNVLTLVSLEVQDPEVAAFFMEAQEESRELLAAKALSLGVVGLKAMGVAGQVEVVEKEFLKLTQGFAAALADLESRMMQRVEGTFDPANAESVTARLGLTIADTYQDATKTIDALRLELQKLVSDSFNPDLTTSCVYRISKLVADSKSDLDQAFDPSYEGSHLSKLTCLIEDYFGEGGTVTEVVAGQVAPIKDELLKAMQEMRDLLVGHASAAEARRLSPISGTDFEDEVEMILRRIAKGYGDAVERVGAHRGDGGSSKKGDFVVSLREGPRFVVESKDHSRPVTLRGSNGILAQLDESRRNRNAGFAIAVMKEVDGFPREVGHFNDYDSDKILCCFGDSGELLETAYRWARTMLLAVANERSVDTETIEAGLNEVREALREMSRIDARARSISKSAEEIRGIVTFQLRRASAGLEQAASGLVVRQAQAS